MSQHTIRFDPERNIVRVVVSGEFHKDEGNAIITESRQAASRHGVGLLYDVRDAVSRVSIGEWFYLPRQLEALNSPLARSQKVAVVASSAQIGDYRFYEDVARNAGLNFRVFSDEREAMSWLGGSGDS